MNNLSPRQVEILRSIIIEYTKTGEPVGSEILDKKYILGVSPATVRNDMAALAKKGYLKKEHFSSGRVPTNEGFRYYINNILKEKELSTAEEVSYKNDVWDFRNEFSKLLQQTTRVLAKRTSLLALATTNAGDMYYFGVNNLLSHKEFFDRDISRCFFERLDEFSYWKGILDYFRETEDEVLFVLGGDEKNDETLDNCGAVFGEFAGNKIRGVIGVSGPARMRYEMIVPSVKYFTHLIEQIVKEQGL